jgi:hypothetical protein
MFTLDASESTFRTRTGPVVANRWNWDVSADGARLIDGLTVYDRAFVPLGSVVLPDPAPAATALSPDGTAVYTLARVSGAWVLRHTDVSGATGPYTADATPLAYVLPATENPRVMHVSEDGGTLFILGVEGTGAHFFHAVPLP